MFNIPSIPKIPVLKIPNPLAGFGPQILANKIMTTIVKYLSLVPPKITIPPLPKAPGIPSIPKPPKIPKGGVKP